MPGLKFRYENKFNETFQKPAVIISNHQSLLDSFYLMTLTPKMVMIANDHVGTNFVTGRMFRWLGFITVGMGIEKMVERVRPYVNQGYSVAIFPEGERPRNVSNFVKRFHKGMIQFADDLQLDIVPIYLHGIVQSMPNGSALSNGGEVVVEVGKRISLDKIQSLGETHKDQAQAVRRLYQAHFTQLCQNQSTVLLLRDAVYDRYRYKGAEIERNAKKALKSFMTYATKIEGQFDGHDFMVIDEAGQGELALLLALMYPERQVFLYLSNEENKEIVEGCLQGYVSNVIQISLDSISSHYISGMHQYVIAKDGSSFENTVGPNPVIIQSK